MGVFEAALAALRVWLPLASLEIHMEHLTAAEHGDLWLRQLGIWSILGHGQSLQMVAKDIRKDMLTKGTIVQLKKVSPAGISIHAKEMF